MPVGVPFDTVPHVFAGASFRPAGPGGDAAVAGAARVAMTRVAS
jgi:hypothetical protein